MKVVLGYEGRGYCSPYFYLHLKFTLLWDIGSQSLDGTIRIEMCHDSFRHVSFLSQILIRSSNPNCLTMTIWLGCKNVQSRKSVSFWTRVIRDRGGYFFCRGYPFFNSDSKEIRSIRFNLFSVYFDGRSAVVYRLVSKPGSDACSCVDDPVGS